jgi:hypothetical protein
LNAVQRTQTKHIITNTKHKILNRTEQNKTKPVLKEKRNVKVLGQNLYTVKPGNKSLIKIGLQLNVQVALLMPLAAEAHLAEVSCDG